MTTAVKHSGTQRVQECDHQNIGKLTQMLVLVYQLAKFIVFFRDILLLFLLETRDVFR